MAKAVYSERRINAALKAVDGIPTEALEAGAISKLISRVQQFVGGVYMLCEDEELTHGVGREARELGEMVAKLKQKQVISRRNR